MSSQPLGHVRSFNHSTNNGVPGSVLGTRELLIPGGGGGELVNNWVFFKNTIVIGTMLEKWESAMRKYNWSII